MKTLLIVIAGYIMAIMSGIISVVLRVTDHSTYANYAMIVSGISLCAASILRWVWMKKNRQIVELYEEQNK